MEAYKLFLQKSFKEVTMNEIMGKAGLSKATFYHYFTSKEQVFKEVITHFYLNSMKTSFTNSTDLSLKDFLQDNYKAINNMSSFFMDKKGEGSIGINYFLPMLDAIRLMPDIMKEIMSNREDELNVWIKIIKTAKNKGEIKSSVKDEQLAKLFIYAADGVGISSILSRKTEKMAKELLSIWEGIYAGLRA
jgi:AcrR family transcriptional regulator